MQHRQRQIRRTQRAHIGDRRAPLLAEQDGKGPIREQVGQQDPARGEQELTRYHLAEPPAEPRRFLPHGLPRLAGEDLQQRGADHQQRPADHPFGEEHVAGDLRRIAGGKHQEQHRPAAGHFENACPAREQRELRVASHHRRDAVPRYGAAQVRNIAIHTRQQQERSAGLADDEADRQAGRAGARHAPARFATADRSAPARSACGRSVETPPATWPRRPSHSSCRGRRSRSATGSGTPPADPSHGAADRKSGNSQVTSVSSPVVPSKATALTASRLASSVVEAAIGSARSKPSAPITPRIVSTAV